MPPTDGRSKVGDAGKDLTAHSRGEGRIVVSAWLPGCATVSVDAAAAAGVVVAMLDAVAGAPVLVPVIVLVPGPGLALEPELAHAQIVPVPVPVPALALEPPVPALVRVSTSTATTESSQGSELCQLVVSAFQVNLPKPVSIQPQGASTPVSLVVTFGPTPRLPMPTSVSTKRRGAPSSAG